MFGTKSEYVFGTILFSRTPTIFQNFMKCLMRMFAEEDQGVIFYETVISLKSQKHTCIECVPLPWAQYEDIPAYFKVHLLCRMSFLCVPDSPWLRNQY